MSKNIVINDSYHKNTLVASTNIKNYITKLEILYSRIVVKYEYKNNKTYNTK